MPKVVKHIDTPHGPAKHCTICGDLKLLHLFVKDDRSPAGRGQPCSACKVSADKARRLRSDVSGAGKKPAATPPKVASKPAKKPSPVVNQEMREAGIKGGAARAVSKDARNVTLPPTPAERSMSLYARAGLALRDGIEPIDPARYQREADKLTEMLPDEKATLYAHQLFQGYAQGIIARYGG